MSLRSQLLVVLWTLVALGGCDAKDARMTVPATPDMAQLKVDLAFTCAQEKDRIPPRDPEAEQLYQHARWLRQANLLSYARWDGDEELDHVFFDLNECARWLGRFELTLGSLRTR